MSLPGASTFLMIAVERASLLWLKHQPTQRSYYLQKLMSYLLENNRYLHPTPLHNFLLQKKNILYANKCIIYVD